LPRLALRRTLTSFLFKALEFLILDRYEEFRAFDVVAEVFGLIQESV